MPFAAMFVPDFPVEAIVRAEPDLRERAVAVVEGTPPLLKVVALNEPAAQLGVEPGMTKMQAAAVLHDSQIRRRSAALETAAHAALLDCACAFSPRVEDTAADTVILDLAGLERIFGASSKIARDLARRCSEVGLEANVAVAGNPDAAMHAARGFAGVTVIPAGKEAERLGGLPVDVLLASARDPERAQEILDTLDRWGVRNLRALAALPEVAITQRLGQEGLRLQQMARGATSRPLVPSEPSLVFEEVAELEYPIELLEPLAFMLNRMLEQLCARLQARALATHELHLRLELQQSDAGHVDREDPTVNSTLENRAATENWRMAKGECRVEPMHAGELRSQHSPASSGQSPAPPSARADERIHERTLRLPVPMLDAKVFLRLLQLDLKANPPTAPIMKIWLRAEPVRPRVTQGGLFLPVSPPPDKLELTLARVASVINSPRRHRDTAKRNDYWRGESRVEHGSTAVNHQSSFTNHQLSSSQRLHGESESGLGSPELLDTHRPGAFRMKRFVPPAADESREISDQSSSASQPPVTALRIIRPPLPASVEVRERRPVRLSCEPPALSGNVIWTAGPWRSSGEWWEQGIGERQHPSLDIGDPASSSESPFANRHSPLTCGWVRDEWDIAVESDSGIVLCRLSHNAATQAWTIEGIYD